jgi:hypothetical protein
MSGRYHTQESSFTLAAAASTTFVFGHESCPFQDVTLWLRGATSIGWSIDFMDETNSYAIGAAGDTGLTAATTPSPTWFLTGVLPPTVRPRVTLTNNGATTVIVTATWLALSHQPNG